MHLRFIDAITKQETDEGKQATNSPPAKPADNQKGKDQTDDVAPVKIPDHDVFNPPEEEAAGELWRLLAGHAAT